MNRNKGLLAIVAIAGSLAIAAIWWYQQPAQVDQATSASTPPDSSASHLDAPPPLPYEFMTLPGLQRGEPQREFIVIRSLNKQLPYRRLSTMVSEDGEDQIAFLHRVRAAMTEYSDRQGFEACGEICSDGTRHSVIVGTISAVAYCAVKPICAEGHTPTNQSIHSHCPKMGRLRATIADEYLSGGTLTRNKTFSRCETEEFSQTDFAGRRPGWLAGRNALYRHDGPARIETFEPATTPTVGEAAP